MTLIKLNLIKIKTNDISLLTVLQKSRKGETLSHKLRLLLLAKFNTKRRFSSELVKCIFTQ